MINISYMLLNLTIDAHLQLSLVIYPIWLAISFDIYSTLVRFGVQ